MSRMHVHRRSHSVVCGLIFGGSQCQREHRISQSQQVKSFHLLHFFKCRNSTAATLAHRVPACMNFHSHMKRRAIPPKAAAAVAANGISPWSPSYLFWPHAQGISFFRPSFARLSGRDTTVRTAEKKRSTTEGRPGRPHARPRRHDMNVYW